MYRKTDDDEDMDEESLILALLDNDISADEIDRKYIGYSARVLVVMLSISLNLFV